MKQQEKHCLVWYQQEEEATKNAAGHYAATSYAPHYNALQTLPTTCN
jgi:hypothetical protein